jgi:hypothetical protein
MSKVILLSGSLDVDFLEIVEKVCGDDAVVDTDLARMAGMSFACGKKETLEKLKLKLSPGALLIETEKLENKNLSLAAIQWLAIGERGRSSNAIFFNTIGAGIGSETAHPIDASDFRRCRLLVDSVPEIKERLWMMRDVSFWWKAIINHWDDICKKMDNDLSKNTNNFIKNILIQAPLND